MKTSVRCWDSWSYVPVMITGMHAIGNMNSTCGVSKLRQAHSREFILEAVSLPPLYCALLSNHIQLRFAIGFATYGARCEPC